KADRIALGDPDLLAAHVLDAADRLVRQQVREAALRETEAHESGCLEPGLETRIHALAHVVDLVERAEEQRDAVEIQCAVALAQAARRERAAGELTDADLAQHLGVVALHAARIELDRDAAVRALANGLRSGAHLREPMRAVGSDSRDLELCGVREAR